MAPEQERDDWLATFILARTEPAGPPDDHLDENALALLALGAASPEELASITRHLAVCAACRKQVTFAEHEVKAPQGKQWHRPILLGLAATLLLSLGLALLARWDPAERGIVRAEASLRAEDWSDSLATVRPLLATPLSLDLRSRAVLVARGAYAKSMSNALARGEFDRVGSLADEAARLGVDSPEIASLHSQAARRIPGPIALALAGRLDRFGIPLSSPLAKALPVEDPTASRALQILESSPATVNADRAVILNRAHALLPAQSPGAIGILNSWLRNHSDDADALVGRGLALYFTGEHAASAASFAAARKIRPDRIDAWVNEALALEASRAIDPALAQWQAILGKEIDPGLRSAVENRVGILRAGRRSSVDRP